MARTVFVGLSGGVDSAVSAALLKREGYNVVGAFIKIWQPEFIECTWREDRLDAMRVCAALGIPFREVDLSQQYKDEVVRDMLDTYAAGRTPNPDVMCNRSIKFGHFSDWAYAQGADLVATGHYARVLTGTQGLELHRGLDTSKDQSYFLYRLTQNELEKIVFPIGAYEKTRVRSLARELGLPVASKSDSQGLCFVGDVSMKDFLARFLKLTEGDVVDEDGTVIGTHEGAALFTVGERHGFGVRSNLPRYVTRVDTEMNRVYVARDRADTSAREVSLEKIHWIGVAPDLPCDMHVQARYRETPIEATLDHNGHAKFAHAHTAAPGQSLVFYDNTRCLGGAVINSRIS